jgi:hypothetical protein
VAEPPVRSEFACEHDTPCPGTRSDARRSGTERRSLVRCVPRNAGREWTLHRRFLQRSATNVVTLRQRTHFDGGAHVVHVSPSTATPASRRRPSADARRARRPRARVVAAGFAADIAVCVATCSAVDRTARATDQDAHLRGGARAFGNADDPRSCPIDRAHRAHRAHHTDHAALERAPRTRALSDHARAPSRSPVLELPPPALRAFHCGSALSTTAARLLRCSGDVAFGLRPT